MRTWLLGTLAFTLLSTMSQAVDQETITTGGQTLALPAPEGVTKVDLTEPMSAELKAAVTSSGNRLLALYGKAPLTLGAHPIFHAQTPKGTEEIVYSIQRFEEITSSLVALLGEGASEGDLRNGETQPLGIYDQGEHHLSFAILGRQSAASEDEEGLLTYVAASMNNVGGKAINLYCLVAAEPESNQALAREQLAAWQQAVLASNPVAQAETIAAAKSPMKQGALLGTLAALVAALIGSRLIKRKKLGSS